MSTLHISNQKIFLKEESFLKSKQHADLFGLTVTVTKPVAATCKGDDEKAEISFVDETGVAADDNRRSNLFNKIFNYFELIR